MTIIIAGVDEAGRGPLAGPVVAGAVILDLKLPIEGLTDSKKLSAEKREALYGIITTRAMAWSAGLCDVEEIDRLNILQATLLAMQRAVAGLNVAPQEILVDGNRCPDFDVPARAIVKGDLTEPAISAASIIAKVTRDRIMLGLHEAFPHYAFDQHKGYGTALHQERLRQHGPCVHHRRSFAPVSQMGLFKE